MLHLLLLGLTSQIIHKFTHLKWRHSTSVFRVVSYRTCRNVIECKALAYESGSSQPLAYARLLRLNGPEALKGRTWMGESALGNTGSDFTRKKQNKT